MLRLANVDEIVAKNARWVRPRLAKTIQARVESVKRILHSERAFLEDADTLLDDQYRSMSKMR